MGEVGDDGAVHLEVDLDGRAAQLGMGRGAGVGGGQPSEPGDIAGQFDDALVVDVVQHKMAGLGFAGAIALGGRGPQSYIWTADGGNTVRPFAAASERNQSAAAY